MLYSHIYIYLYIYLKLEGGCHLSCGDGHKLEPNFSLLAPLLRPVLYVSLSPLTALAGFLRKPATIPYLTRDNVTRNTFAIWSNC